MDLDQVKNKSLGKALMLLECFSSSRQELSITELSEALDLYKSNVHNLVSTFEKMGYLVKNKSSGKYTLGIKFLKYSHIALNQIEYRKAILPYLTNLCQEFNEHMTLSVPLELEALYLDSIYPQSIYGPIRVGHTLPLHCSGEGKVLLAFGDPARLERLLKTTLIAYTPNTIIDPNKLRAVVEQTRAQGYGYASMEYTFTNASVSVPIFDEKQNFLAALTVAGPAQHFTKERCEHFVLRMREVIQQLQAARLFTVAFHMEDEM